MKYLALLLALTATADAKRCKRDSDCAAGMHCTTPEEQTMGICGKPHPPDEVKCPDGHTGNVCGQCYKTCKTSRDCPKGKSCDGEICVSPKQCFPPKRPMP
jgi:hypothetical protein